MQNHWSKGVWALHNEIMKADAILLFTVEEISVSNITVRNIHHAVLPFLKDNSLSRDLQYKLMCARTLTLIITHLFYSFSLDFFLYCPTNNIIIILILIWQYYVIWFCLFDFVIYFFLNKWIVFLTLPMFSPTQITCTPLTSFYLFCHGSLHIP